MALPELVRGSKRNEASREGAITASSLAVFTDIGRAWAVAAAPTRITPLLVAAGGVGAPTSLSLLTASDKLRKNEMGRPGANARVENASRRTVASVYQGAVATEKDSGSRWKGGRLWAGNIAQRSRRTEHTGKRSHIAAAVPFGPSGTAASGHACAGVRRISDVAYLSCLGDPSPNLSTRPSPMPWPSFLRGESAERFATTTLR